MKQVTLITDGACVNNPGPGGWSFILRYGQASIERAGGVLDATNNRMEIRAAIEGLKALREPCEVLLISDSTYLLNGINSRNKWRESGWIKCQRGHTIPVPNADLWQEIDQIAERHTMTGRWVKGHSGHPDNERCNELAEEQARLYAGAPNWASLIEKAA